jgi:hypothetical protein
MKRSSKSTFAPLHPARLNGERGRVPRLKVAGAHAKEKFRNTQIACCTHAYENGIDESEIVNWEWPF